MQPPGIHRGCSLAFSKFTSQCWPCQGEPDKNDKGLFFLVFGGKSVELR